MAGILAHGAGAAEGLDNYVQQLAVQEELALRRQQLGESTRHNQAQETLQGELNRQNAQLRADAQKALEMTRADATKDRRSNIALKAAEMQPIGSLVTDEDAGEQMNAGVPRANYDWNPGNLGMTVASTPETATQPATPGAEVPGKLPGFRWTGSQKDLSAADKLELDTRRAAATKEYQGRRATTAEGELELRKEWGPPVVPVSAPNVPGGVEYATRGTAPGKAAPQPVGERERVDNYKNALKTIARIKRLGEKTNWKGIGPIAGRVGSAAYEYAGIGSKEEEELRNALSQFQQETSMDRGGKTFTAQEKAMINEFMASYKQNPRAAITRLDQFGTSASQYLKQQGVDMGDIEGAEEKPPDLVYDPKTRKFVKP